MNKAEGPFVGVLTAAIRPTLNWEANDRIAIDISLCRVPAPLERG
jgi:hypothetical protein